MNAFSRSEMGDSNKAPESESGLGENEVAELLRFATGSKKLLY